MWPQIHHFWLCFSFSFFPLKNKKSGRGRRGSVWCPLPAPFGACILEPNMEAEDRPFICCCKKLKESPMPLDETSNYMQNNFSQENDTSQVNSKAGEGCYGSQSKIHPVMFHLRLSDGTQSASGEIEWKGKRAGSETCSTFEENPAKKIQFLSSKKKSQTRRLSGGSGVGWIDGQNHQKAKEAGFTSPDKTSR